jgi:glycosyltransferase involved in cell wall biosynthesis
MGTTLLHLAASGCGAYEYHWRLTTPVSAPAGLLRRAEQARCEGNEPRMRIAINASIVDSVLSGLGIYTVNLLKELTKHHGDFVVYTSCPELCAVYAAECRKISRGVQPSHGRRGHLRRLAWIQTCLPIRLWIDRGGVLLCPLPEGMLFPSIPQVVVVHDVLPLRFTQEYPRQQYYFRHLVPAILKRSSAIVALSENTKRDMLEFYNVDSTAVHVVSAGYDQSRYRTGIPPEGIQEKYRLRAYLLYVGNLLPHKNLHNLLKAFSLIAPQFPHTLVIAGKKDPRYHPKLEAEARALGVLDRVSWLDYVPAAELPALYAGAEVFVLPSLYEGFGLPILEAMACGTPVVASHAGSIPEVAGSAAALIDPYDIPAMAETLATVLMDQRRRDSMRCRGLKQVQRFTWGKTAQEVLALLHRVGER